MGYLSELARLLKDFCGVLNEESLRENFALCNEILDESLVRFVVVR